VSHISGLPRWHKSPAAPDEPTVEGEWQRTRRDFWRVIGSAQWGLFLLVAGVIAAAGATWIAQADHLDKLATAEWAICMGIGLPFLAFLGVLVVVWQRALRMQRDEARTELRRLERSLAANEDDEMWQERAEAQLAAAIRSGNVLRRWPSDSSPLLRQWGRRTRTLVHEIAGDLEATRLTGTNLLRWLARLDDLAGSVTTGARALSPSESWDRYVYVMRAFRDGLELAAREGERIRTMFLERDTPTHDEAERQVDAWLQSVDEVLGLTPDLRSMFPSPYPVGTGFRYEGLSDEVSNVLGRLDHRLEALKPFLQPVDAYVQALGATNYDPEASRALLTSEQTPAPDASWAAS
jgi:hypothetical protein